jgi:hypothetical protein
VHAVHDRPGAEEHAGLEEAVCQQVDQAQRVRRAAEADRQEHVADLGDRRVGEHPLDVVLGRADDASDQQRHRADGHHDVLRCR